MLWQGAPDRVVNEVLAQYTFVTESSNETLTNVTTLSRRQSIFADPVVDCGMTSIASATRDSGLPVYKMVFEAGIGFHGATLPFILDRYTSYVKTCSRSLQHTL